MATALERYYALVLDKVADDDYPSGELMDRLEDAMSTPEQLEEYLSTLLEKIEDDHYPSKQMLDRIHRLAPVAHLLSQASEQDSDRASSRSARR